MSEHYIFLEFGYVPTSPYYKNAVDLAQKMNGYNHEGDGKSIKHLVPIDEMKGEEWLELYDIVKNWKTTKLHYGDQIAAPVYMTLYILACFIRRCEVENNKQYCNRGNWIGCQRVFQSKKLGLTDGNFDGAEIFIPDQDAIRKSVISHASEMYSICPVFDLERAITEINKLPSEIYISDNPNWIPIIKPEYHSGIMRLSGISYVEGEKKKGPIIESVDALDGYKIENGNQYRSSQSIWEHKIVSIKHEDWVSQAKEGKISEINEFGKKGWNLVSTILIDEIVYCVFQRNLIV